MVNMCHRVDHFLSNLNTLYKSKTKDLYFDEDIYLLGRNSLTWLLQAGTHRIHVPQPLRLHPEKNYVGFFPMGSACNKCTTTGLKWNLSKSCHLCILQKNLQFLSHFLRVMCCLPQTCIKQFIIQCAFYII